MDAMTYSTASANLASVMNRVCEDHEPLLQIAQLRLHY